MEAHLFREPTDTKARRSEWVVKVWDATQRITQTTVLLRKYFTLPRRLDIRRSLRHCYIPIKPFVSK